MLEIDGTSSSFADLGIFCLLEVQWFNAQEKGSCHQHHLCHHIEFLTLQLPTYSSDGALRCADPTTGYEYSTCNFLGYPSRKLVKIPVRSRNTSENYRNEEIVLKFMIYGCTTRSYRLDSGICNPPTVPPSTFRMTPVHQAPARDEKYIQAPAMSFSFPIRPSGTLFEIVSWSAPHDFSPSDILEGTKPGAKQLTVMCFGAKSAENFLVSW